MSLVNPKIVETTCFAFLAFRKRVVFADAVRIISRLKSFFSPSPTNNIYFAAINPSVLISNVAPGTANITMNI